MLEGANILQAQEAQEYTVMMSKMTTTELDQYLLSLPSVPAELTKKDAERVGMSVIVADSMVNIHGSEIGLVFYCKKCNQYHIHSLGGGVRRAHCTVAKDTYNFGHYYLVDSKKKVVILQ